MAVYLLYLPGHPAPPQGGFGGWSGFFFSLGRSPCFCWFSAQRVFTDDLFVGRDPFLQL